jgi:hypothetical protein
MSVVKPPQFNERFTIYLNAAGEPVQRTLSEMTADEVMQAINWHDEEADRLEREAGPLLGLAVAVEAGTLDPTPNMLRDAAQGLRQASDAQIKSARLLEQVRAILSPQWQRHQNVTLTAALRRWWPGGRNAA